MNHPKAPTRESPHSERTVMSAQHSSTDSRLFPLAFSQLREPSSSPDPEPMGNLSRITYNWLARAAEYSGEGPLAHPTPSFGEGASTKKPSCDNPLQAGTAGLTKMAAPLWQQCGTIAMHKMKKKKKRH